MKKSMFIAIILIVAIAALPIIGNSFMKKTIDEKLIELKSYGLHATRDETDSAYLKTSRHFEFLLQDSQKFIDFLNTYSDKRIPSYVNAAVAGTLVGVDVEYSNLLFAKSFSVDAYPLTLSSRTSEWLMEEDPGLRNYLNEFLQSKGIAYHIDYNLINNDFKGFLKNVKESYVFKNGAKASLDLAGAAFKGSGQLIFPDRFTSTIKKINMNIKDDKIDVTFNLAGFSATSSFESLETYQSSLNLKSFEFSVKEKDENLSVASSKIKVNISSSAQGEKMELTTKSSIKEILLKLSQADVKIEDFKYEFALQELSKAAFEKLSLVASRANGTQKVDKELLQGVVDLASKGFMIKVPVFFVKNITLNASEELKGFDLRSTIKVREDQKLISKIVLSPFLLAKNVDMELNIKLSKEMYDKLLEVVPASAITESYAKQDGGDVVFDLIFNDETFRINGETL